MTDSVKSMELFAIDNAGVWGKGAQLIGDYVVWPDKGKYPSYTPVGILTHPNFDGTIVVQAGNLGIVVSFVAGIPSADKDGLRAALSDKVKRPEQYRLSIDAIVHRLILAGAGSERDLSNGPVPTHGQGVEPLALLTWMARTSPVEAAVIGDGLRRVLAKPQALEYGPLDDAKQLAEADVYQRADEMLATIDHALKQG